MADPLTRLLEWVAITALWNPDCRETRNDAILAAREAGASLRLIADYAGVSHQAVHKIVRGPKLDPHDRS
jgi:hypothetical protein